MKKKSEFKKLEINFNQGEIFKKYCLGVKYFKRKCSNKDMQVFDEIIKKYPTHIHALVFKGRILNKRKKYIEAIQCFEQALKISPEFFFAQVEMVYTLPLVERASEVMVYVDQILKRFPDNVDFLIIKAIDLQVKGKIEESNEIKKLLFEKYPKHPYLKHLT